MNTIFTKETVGPKIIENGKIDTSKIGKNLYLSKIIDLTFYV